MGYLVCKECRGYYKLQEGELPENFTDKCDCGGNLRYALSIDVVGKNTTFQSKEQNTEKKKETKKSSPKSTNKLEKSPVVAVILNLLIAGLGFVYIDEFGDALFSLLFVVTIGYLFGLTWGIVALLIVMLWTYDKINKYNSNLNIDRI